MVSPVLLLGPANAESSATASTHSLVVAAKLPKLKLTIKAPSTAKKKSTITIKTKGLEPGEAVGIGIGGENMGDELYTGVANKKGKVKVSIKLPTSVSKGKWTLTVYASTLKRKGTKTIKDIN
ncbi:MAG: hypothetical protein JWP10_1101 [Nocardioidaceae bacterium]|nr:hypothetical protein [Nocardioidaceae bacterium]